MANTVFRWLVTGLFAALLAGAPASSARADDIDPECARGDHEPGDPCGPGLVCNESRPGRGGSRLYCGQPTEFTACGRKAEGEACNLPKGGRGSCRVQKDTDALACVEQPASPVQAKPPPKRSPWPIVAAGAGVAGVVAALVVVLRSRQRQRARDGKAPS
ncbi:MAG: hypothetical protein U0271_15605 [Polyangiaceae bacterium]